MTEPICGKAHYEWRPRCRHSKILRVGVSALPTLGLRSVDCWPSWWNNPSTQEAKAIANLAFEHDEAGTTFRPLVSPYSLGELAGLSRLAPGLDPGFGNRNFGSDPSRRSGRTTNSVGPHSRPPLSTLPATALGAIFADCSRLRCWSTVRRGLRAG